MPKRTVKEHICLAWVVALIAVACTGQSAPPAESVGEAPAATSTPNLSTSTTVLETTTTSPEEIRPLEICAGYGGWGFGVTFDPTVLDAYAETHAGVWGGWWVADSGDGPLVVVVTDDPGPHEDAIRLLVPDELAIEVRRGTFTLDDLGTAATELENASVPGFLGTYLSRWLNQVIIEVVADTPEMRAALLGLDPLLYCLAPFTGPVTPWGEQPQAGAAWRLLGESLISPVYLVSLAATPAGFETMWNRFFAGPLPEIDFGSEVVAYIGGVISSGCPQIRFDELVIDRDRGVVYPLISRPGLVGGCLMDAGPHGYAIAVDRAALPDEFRLQFGPEPYTYPGDIRDLEVDLTNPNQDTDVWGLPRVSILVAPDYPDQLAPLTFRFFDEVGKLIIDPTGMVGPESLGMVWGPYPVESGVIRLEVEVEVCGSDGCNTISRTGTCEIRLSLESFTDSIVTLKIPDLTASEEVCSLEGR